MDYKFNKEITGQMLSDENTYAFVLLCIILAYLPEGEDDLADIDTEVLFADLEEDFKCKIPEENENKINAAITVLNTDLFYRSFPVATSVSLAFADGDIGNIADGEEEEIDACKLLWATLETGLISDLSFIESVGEFSNNVINKINEILDDEAEEKNSDIDEIDEVMRDPYYHKYISYHLLQLTSQLLKLGVNSSIVRELWTSYTDSIDSLSQ